VGRGGNQDVVRKKDRPWYSRKRNALPGSNRASLRKKKIGKFLFHRGGTLIIPSKGLQMELVIMEKKRRMPLSQLRRRRSGTLEREKQQRLRITEDMRGKTQYRPPIIMEREGSTLTLIKKGGQDLFGQQDCSM